MSTGFVYILTNPSMPGIVKIGKTTRSVRQRCDELWQTGVPTPFTIYAEFRAPDCHTLEKEVHLALAAHRVSLSREFFTITPSEAEDEVAHWHRSQVEALVETFMPHHKVVPDLMVINEAALSVLAEDLGIHPCKAMRALELATSAEIYPALRRLDERFEKHLRLVSQNG